MKITIAVLAVLLIGVSGWSYYDHTNLTKKNDNQTVTITKMQSASAKQATTIKALLSCANSTEKSYQQTKQYSSVISCIKTRLGI